MNEFTLKVNGEDNKVDFSMSTTELRLSVENARFLSDALAAAADHAAGTGRYENEVSLFYKDPDDKVKVGFESETKEKKKKEDK